MFALLVTSKEIGNTLATQPTPLRLRRKRDRWRHRRRPKRNSDVSPDPTIVAPIIAFGNVRGELELNINSAEIIADYRTNSTLPLFLVKHSGLI